MSAGRTPDRFRYAASVRSTPADPEGTDCDGTSGLGWADWSPSYVKYPAFGEPTMSTLRYSATSSSWSRASPPTYFVGPSVSDPQKANRTALVIRGCDPMADAASSNAATPEPLSLAPGLRGKLSRCAPASTTFFSSPVFVCATMFRDLTMTGLLSSTSRTGALVRRSAASASLSITPTGTVSCW